MTSIKKSAPWVGGVLGLMMTAISSITPAAAQSDNPNARTAKPFDHAYATSVAHGIERACREINDEFLSANLKVPLDSRLVKDFQDLLQAKIYAHTKRLPGDVAEGYAGGAEKYLSVIGSELRRHTNIRLATQTASAECARFLQTARSVPTTDRGGFRPPVQEGPRVPKPQGW